VNFLVHIKPHKVFEKTRKQNFQQYINRP